MSNQLTQTLEQKQARLILYYEREKEMLSKNGIKSYAIGSKNLSRYDTSLKDIQDSIKQLEIEIKEIEAALQGKTSRKAVAVIPRDW